MADTARIKANIETMINQGAPEQDIDDYVASEGVTLEQLQGAPSAPRMSDDQINKEVGDRIYKGDSLDSIKTFLSNSGKNPNEYQGLEAAVKYKQRGLPGRSDVATAPTPEVKKPEYDAGHGAFGAGVDGALHSIPYVDEAAGALDAAIPTGQGLSVWETGKGFGEQMNNNIDQNRAMAEYDWNNHPYAYGTGMGVGVVGSAVAGGAAVRGLASLPGAAGRVAGVAGADTALANTGRAAATGAVYGSDVDNGTLGDRLEGASIGAAAGAVGDRVFRGAARVAQPVVEPAVQALKAAGVRLSPGQITGGVGRFVEDQAAKLPFVGNQVKRIQRQSYDDLNKAMINRAIEPSGSTLVDAESRRAPGVLGNNQVPVSEEGRSLWGTVMRPGNDWLAKAREVVEAGKPKKAPISVEQPSNPYNTPENTNSILDGLTDSRTGLLKNELNGSSADYEIGKIIDHEILFALDRDEPMDALKVADVIQNLRAKSKELEYAGLKPSELRDAQGRIGDIEDLFMTHMDNITRPAPGTETVSRQIGSERIPAGVKTASNDLGRIEDAAGESLDGELFTPQEYMFAAKSFKTSDGPGSATQLARDASTVMRGPVASNKPMSVEDMLRAGLPVGGLAYLSPKGAAFGALASGVYTQPGRKAVEALLTGNRGIVGDTLSQTLRGGAAVAPRAGGLYGSDYPER